MPIGIGAVLKGRDSTEKEYRDPCKLPTVDVRFMTSACPHNCVHCFTGRKERKLSLLQIKQIIDKLTPFKPKGIELEGEGEPTIDPWFFDIIEYTSSKGIVPTVYTEAATKLRDRNFVKRLKKTKASICVKIDSFYNADYENKIVGDKTKKYFQQRNKAIKVLMKEGFNKVKTDGTTRLGFIMVISKKNLNEIPQILRFCRKNNIWIMFNTLLHTGKVLGSSFDEKLLVTEKEKAKYREIVRRIDENEFGFKHEKYTNFTTAPCVEFMLIHTDGTVSVCTGNLETVGNIITDSIPDLRKKLGVLFPNRDPTNFNGHCPFRPKIK